MMYHYLLHYHGEAYFIFKEIIWKSASLVYLSPINKFYAHFYFKIMNIIRVTDVIDYRAQAYYGSMR